MKKVLLTGGTGFVGKNIAPLLRDFYDLYVPTRTELDLRDEKAVEKYVSEHKFDLVIQCANPNPVKNAAADKSEDFLSDSLRIFMNFYRVRDHFGKMFYLGSGAEYGKTEDITLAKEEEIGSRIPKDGYGLAKLYMNELARASENVYNLRIFGCYGPFDHESKFLTHVIRSCIRKEQVTIRQECMFDYMQVYDLANIIRRMDEAELKHHDYNICSGKRIALSEIAKTIMKKMGVTEDVLILKEGMNLEYTGSTERIREELGADYILTSLEDGIDIQIEFEKKYLECSK